MRLTSFVAFFVVVACGGSSRRLDGSRGDGSNGGDAGDESGGSGGTAGTAGNAGTAGVAGDATEPSGGVGNGGGSGGVAGTDPTGGSAGDGATPSITSCSEAFRFAGTWEGSVLDLFFEPLEPIRLVVTPDDLGGYQGTLTIGTGDQPPPVNADEPYPNLEFWGTAGRGPVIEPWPGFQHTVVRGAGCDNMFRVGISSAEPWNLWCSFQDPIYSEGYGWACTVRSSRGSGGVGLCRVEDDRGQSFEYPSWKCHACGTFIPEVAVCSCTAAGCWFNQTPTDTYELVLIDDGVLSGPDPNCGDCTVRLERVE